MPLDAQLDERLERICIAMALERKPASLARLSQIYVIGQKYTYISENEA